MTRILSVYPSSVKKLLKLILIILCAVLATYAQTRYAITELTLRGGSSSGANSINDEGQVTGCSDSSQHPGVSRAFLYSHHKIFDIGTLPGGTNSCGTLITNFGLIAGWSTPSSGSTITFLYYQGRMTAFTIDGFTFADMSNFGEVVGTKDHAAVLYSHGKVIDLGVLPGKTVGSAAYAINDWGQVVGVSYSYIGHFADYTGFIYSRGKMYRIEAMPNEFQTVPADINNLGQVTGSTSTWQTMYSHAFFYRWGKMTDIGTLGGNYSRGRAINNRGRVVGDAATTDNSSHAFLYRNGKMIDLNDLIPAGSGWVLNSATDINDAGQIVGYGTRYGTERAFLLTPIGHK